MSSVYQFSRNSIRFVTAMKCTISGYWLDHISNPTFVDFYVRRLFLCLTLPIQSYSIQYHLIVFYRNYPTLPAEQPLPPCPPVARPAPLAFFLQYPAPTIQPYTPTLSYPSVTFAAYHHIRFLSPIHMTSHSYDPYRTCCTAPSAVSASGSARSTCFSISVSHAAISEMRDVCRAFRRDWNYYFLPLLFFFFTHAPMFHRTNMIFQLQLICNRCFAAKWYLRSTTSELNLLCAVTIPLHNIEIDVSVSLDPQSLSSSHTVTDPFYSNLPWFYRTPTIPAGSPALPWRAPAAAPTECSRAPVAAGPEIQNN